MADLFFQSHHQQYFAYKYQLLSFYHLQKYMFLYLAGHSGQSLKSSYVESHNKLKGVSDSYDEYKSSTMFVFFIASKI